MALRHIPRRRKDKLLNRGTYVSPSFGKVEIHQENKVAGAKDRPNDGATHTKVNKEWVRVYVRRRTVVYRRVREKNGYNLVSDPEVVWIEGMGCLDRRDDP